MDHSIPIEELRKRKQALEEDLEATLAAESSGDARVKIRELYREIRDLGMAILNRQHELHFSLEAPEPLAFERPFAVEGLPSLEAVRELRELTAKQLRALIALQDGVAEEDRERFISRRELLRAQSNLLLEALTFLEEKSYKPGPGDPPAYEPEGYSAQPGFVKANPLNNEYYVEQFKGDPWYYAIRSAHDQLEALAPGYNIIQIKAKFGGLRYYYHLPENIEPNPERRAFSTVEEIRGQADRIIARAEGWVDGYEYAKGSETLEAEAAEAQSKE